MSAAAERVPVGTVVTTDVPTRLDRLGWSAWHTRVVLALGITWLLDGLEASLVATLAALLSPDTLGLSATQVGAASTVYLVGQVAGALFFGWLTDRLGRKKLFLVTIAVYLGATALSGLAPNFIVFVIWRFFAGAGIGGEYSAINSAIDELIPARLRGQIDLAVNGSYWLGVAGGAALVDVVLNPRILPHAWGWRIAFGLGALIGLVILFVRRHLPESPRWYLMHGRIGDAQAEISRIEDAVRATRGGALPAAVPVRVRVSGSIGLAATARIVLGKHRRRTILGLTLMLAQTFFYNAIFFSFALILGQIYGVPEDHVGRYLLPFAAGNFLGPLCIGRLFDTLGRRTMIATTYIASGVLLIATGFAFQHGWLDATTQTICWCVVFFFASSAASSAYLTVSELFPVEIRGLAIALFYAFSTAMGAVAPSIFGAFVDMYRRTHSRTPLFCGYLIGAVLMIGAGLVARAIGVDAERKSLEDLAGAPPADLAATRT